MTTAHRPTWKAAVGRSGTSGNSAMISHLDLASHTQLKFRPDVVDKAAAVKESLLKLEGAQRTIGRRVMNPTIEEEGRVKLLLQQDDVNVERVKSKYDDEDLKNDNDSDDDGWSDDSEDEDEDNSDDDDEAALQAELAKIRAEREAQQEVQQQEEDNEAALQGNPLLLPTGSATTGRLKRRWNDDVVFRNQAKGEPQVQKRFINDTVRNDFHKRFMNKFIK